MKIKKNLLCGFGLSFCVSLFAMPIEIVLIRHADKFGPNPGQVITAKGYVRAINFAFYYLNKFKDPDFIIATNPIENKTSIRELQTIAPLVSMLLQKKPNIKMFIYHPYSSNQFDALAKYVLGNKKFDGKSILICWDHTKIPSLAHALGVKQNIPKWASNDYDSVYIFRFSNKKLASFTILNHQYPVSVDWSWESLEKLLKTPN